MRTYASFEKKHGPAGRVLLRKMQQKSNLGSQVAKLKKKLGLP